MSVPVLRQPKNLAKQQKNKNSVKFVPDTQYVIVTLKDSRKLVVSSDGYHGVITAGDCYQCVFCKTIMELDSITKEKHKNSIEHIRILEKAPHMSEYSKNLVRQITKDSSFCTICNVVISNINLIRHHTTDAHIEELEKAVIRADTYKPDL